MRSGEAQNSRSADVLAGEVHGAEVELFDQKVQVLGGGLAVVGARPVVRVTEPAQIRCIDTVAVGEQRDELVESPLRFGEPMDQQNRSSCSARRHVVQLSPVDLGVMVRSPGQ